MVELDSFADGAIVRLTMEDFLTYEHVTYNFNSSLNVIFGPNGSGKSSIICGICLCLGGNASVLGRQSHMSDFIRWDQTEGFVELEVNDSKAETNPIYKFKISKLQPNKYLLNGKETSREKIRESVTKYGIQVDNPCTFLPQDKVKSFAEQSPQELLENSQKAIGSGELWQKQQKLVDFSKGGKEKEELLTQKCRVLEQKKEQIERVGQEVLRLVEFEKHNSHLTTLKQKKTLTELEQRIFLENEAKERKIEKQKELEGVKSQFDPLKNEIEKIQQKMRRTGDELAKQLRDNNVRKDYAGVVKRYGRNLDEMKQNIESTRNGWQTAKDRVVSAKAEVQQKKGIVLAVEKQLRGDLANEEEIDRLKERQTATSRELHEFQSNANRIRSVIDENQWKRDQISEDIAQLRLELSRLGASEHQRMSALNFLNQHAANAYRFYRENREQFRGEVFVPVLHVEVAESVQALFLETLIPQRDLPMLICQCRQDEDLLQKEAANRRWRIPSTTVDRPEAVRNARIPAELSRLGFKDMACNIFKAPPHLYHYLNSIARLDKVPLADRSVESRLEEATGLVTKFGFGTFLTPTMRISLIRSRYGGNVSTRIDQLKERAEYLQVAQMSNRAAQQRQQLQAKETELREMADSRASEEAEVNESDAKIEQCRQKMRQLNEKIHARPRKELELRQQKNRLEEAERHLAEVGAEVGRKFERWRELSSSSVERRCTLMKEMRAALGVCSRSDGGNSNAKKSSLTDESHMRKLIGLTVCQQSADRKQRHIDDNYQQAELIQAELETLSERFRHLRQETRNVRQVWHQQTDFETIDAAKVLPEMSKQFEHLIAKIGTIETDGVEELDAAIGIEEAAIGNMANVNQRAKEQYRNLENDVKHLSHEFQRLQTDVGAWETRVEALRADWMEPLEQLVDEISTRFTRFFTLLDCRGHVRLRPFSNQPHDYGKYGLSLEVSFRVEEETQPLTASVQSGGERSVATMLYLLALQQLTDVPFRCVDEINQGMDGLNERRVFKIMVDLLKEQTPDGRLKQYFMLSPKVLSDMACDENMNVIIVHNGDNISECSVEKLLGIMDVGGF